MCPLTPYIFTPLCCMYQSNFNAQRVGNAAKVLKGRGTCLSSNQVQYSLLYRKPETNGGE